MKINTSFVVALGLGIAANCFGQARPAAKRQAKPIIEGAEKLEPYIRDHFEKLLSKKLDSVDSGSGAMTITDNGYESLIVFDTGEELRITLIVRGDDGTYKTAFQVAVGPDVPLVEGEQVDLDATVLVSNIKVMQRSIRLGMLKTAIKEGKDLATLVRTQVALQEAESATEGNSMNAASAAEAASVSCVQQGSTICCGFIMGAQVRVICICNLGSNNVKVCLDTGWI